MATTPKMEIEGKKTGEEAVKWRPYAAAIGRSIAERVDPDVRLERNSKRRHPFVIGATKAVPDAC